MCRENSRYPVVRRTLSGGHVQSEEEHGLSSRLLSLEASAKPLAPLGTL